MKSARDPVLRRLLRYARPYLWTFVASAAFMALLAACLTGRAYLLLPFFDDVMSPAAAARGLPASPWLGALPAGVAETASRLASDSENLINHAQHSFVALIFVAIAIALLQPIALFGSNYLARRALARVNLDIQRELAAKLMRLPLAHHRETSTGDTLARILTDAERAQVALELILKQFVLAANTLILGAIAILAVSWQLAALTAAMAPVTIGVTAYFASRVRKSSSRRQAQFGEVAQRLVGILAGIKVIKAFRGEKTENAAFSREAEKFFRRHMKVVWNSVASQSAVELVTVGTAMGVLSLGTWLVLRGQWDLTTGRLLAFGTLMSTMYRPVKQISRGWTRLMESAASAERFFSILDTPEESSDPPDAIQLEGLRQQIRFHRVSFAFRRELVFHDVSFEIRAGEVVAIVGPTGAGKSTLVDLLLRFYQPSSGRIEIDGVDLQRVARTSLLENTAIVTQEPFLFDTSIRENVLYGRPDASDEDFDAAAHAAHIDDFVQALPDGYDTQVGEFGLLLSGGQRQRITIARAILSNPAILIFDEATSALDAKTERSVQLAIDSLRGNRTILVIAHRLSTIRAADRIVVLEDGRISQQGTPEELAAIPGYYRELLRLQEQRELHA